MSPEKLSNNEMGCIGAPCEFIHPLVMGNVMCNERQQKNGKNECPIEKVWDGKCPAQSSKYMGW